MCLALLLQPPEGESLLLHLFADTRRVLSRGDDQDLPGFQRAGDGGGGRRGGRGGAGGAGHGASRRRGQREPAKRPGHHLLPTTVSTEWERGVRLFLWLPHLLFLCAFVFLCFPFFLFAFF